MPAGTGLSDLPGGKRSRACQENSLAALRRTARFYEPPPNAGLLTAWFFAVIERPIYFFQVLAQESRLSLLRRLDSAEDHKADSSQEQVRHRDHEINAPVVSPGLS
jgi:hypothetical protein